MAHVSSAVAVSASIGFRDQCHVMCARHTWLPSCAVAFVIAVINFDVAVARAVGETV